MKRFVFDTSILAAMKRDSHDLALASEGALATGFGPGNPGFGFGPGNPGIHVSFGPGNPGFGFGPGNPGVWTSARGPVSV